MTALAKHEAKKREDRRMTAATERVTGKFYCTSSAHWATGKSVKVGTRKICQSCADKRAKILKGKPHG